MQRPAGIDQRREPAASDRAAAVLAGIVDRVLFERPETGYRVLRVRAAGERDLVVVVGTLPPAEPGELIRAEGAWYDDRSWGRQFRATTASFDAPASEAGLVAYLGSGRIKGVGEELARRLVGPVRRPAGRDHRARAAAPARRRGRRPEARQRACRRRGRGTAGPATRWSSWPSRACRRTAPTGSWKPMASTPSPRSAATPTRWPGTFAASASPPPTRSRSSSASPRIRCSGSVRPWPRCCARPPTTATPPCRWPTPGTRLGQLLHATPDAVDRRDRSASSGPAGWWSWPTTATAI